MNWIGLKLNPLYNKRLCFDAKDCNLPFDVFCQLELDLGVVDETGHSNELLNFLKLFPKASFDLVYLNFGGEASEEVDGKS